MNNPRIAKVFKDIFSDKLKSLLLVLAIAVGVFAIGAISGAYSVLSREMAKNYLGTLPADATIKIDGDSLRRNLTDEIKNTFSLRTAERHATVSARMKVGDNWYPVLLFVIDNFNNISTNKISRLSGSWPPPYGTMLVEQTALRVMKAGMNSSIIIKTPHGEAKPLRISGIVHDAGLAPAWQEQQGYGYITLSTLNNLGEKQGFDELRVIFNCTNKTAESNESGSKKIAEYLEKRGFTVHEVQIPPPRRHPHQGQMNAILTLFTAFSFMILILSSILVANSISTMMTKQVREIGIMKTIGAGSLQISSLYLFMIILFSSAALVIAVPLSRFPADILITKVASNLNLIIYDSSIPQWVAVMQILSGILIPAAVSAFPVLKGGRITVRKAVTNYGVSNESLRGGLIDKLLSRFQGLSEVFMLALRNIFRQRSRLLLTLTLLASGGALFITALNVSKAWNVKLEQIYINRHYDIEVRLGKAITTDRLTEEIKKLNGIKGTENYLYSPVSFASGVSYDLVHTYPDKGHGSFTLVALPVKSSQLNLPMLEGKWLDSERASDVVLNHWAHSQAPNIIIGDSVALLVEGKITKWKVTGFTEDVGSPAAAYVSIAALRQITKMENLSNMLRISTNKRDQNSVQPKIAEIEDILKKESAPVVQVIPLTMLRTAMAEHMSVLIGALFAMSVLLGIVGALGLLSSMSTNILERTRELGVMKAIGAAPEVIGRLVALEGLFTGLLSLPLALCFSLATTKILGNVVGNMAFKTPLSLEVSITGVILWTVIVVLGSILATLYPAWRASHITTREALVYE